VVGRLIHYQQIGIREQQAHQHCARSLATRKLRQRTIEVIRFKTQSGQSLPDARLIGVTAAPLELLLQGAVAF
jgi:hypothetical protein